MKRLLLALPAYLFMLLAATSYGEVGPKQLTIDIGNLIATTTLDAASTSFTVSQTPNSGGYGLLLVYVQVTDASNSVTALNLSCTTARSNINSGAAYTAQSCTTATGVCTSSNASWTKDPSGITSPKRWVWRVDVEGFEDITCTFTDTGGDSSDSIRVEGAWATKGS